MSLSPAPGAPRNEFVLTIVCPDRPGIVHAVTGFLVQRGGNILESQQYDDRDTGRFFMRMGFEVSDPGVTAERLRVEFAAIAHEYAMDFQLWDARAPYRTLLMVSGHLHCLNDLLFRHSTGSLQIEIPLVVSNHLDAEPLAKAYGLDFAHIPVTPDTKEAAEARLLELVEKHGIHLVVLARYMQVLSPQLCDALPGRIINIHHSFLPSFRGGRPYDQAYEHGVKLIGATAHYVTAQLDEGPIIEQEVARVGHAHEPEQLASVGRDLECVALARAVRWHLEHRVLLDGQRTVVFP